MTVLFTYKKYHPNEWQRLKVYVIPRLPIPPHCQMEKAIQRAGSDAELLKNGQCAVAQLSLGTWRHHDPASRPWPIIIVYNVGIK